MRSTYKTNYSKSFTSKEHSFVLRNKQEQHELEERKKENMKQSRYILRSERREDKKSNYLT